MAGTSSGGRMSAMVMPDMGTSMKAAVGALSNCPRAGPAVRRCMVICRGSIHSASQTMTARSIVFFNSPTDVVEKHVQPGTTLHHRTLVVVEEGAEVEIWDELTGGADFAPSISGQAFSFDGVDDAEQVHHEDQRLAGLDDAAGAAVAVAEVRRDDELAAAADLHAGDTLVPAGDDLADAETERQRLAAVVGGVELLTGRVGDPDVVHDDSAAGRGLHPRPRAEVGDLQVGRRGRVGEVDLGLVGLVRAHERGSPQDWAVWM